MPRATELELSSFLRSRDCSSARKLFFLSLFLGSDKTWSSSTRRQIAAGKNRWIHVVEQSLKSVPFVTNKRPFVLVVCKVVLGVAEFFHLNHSVKVDPVKPQIKCNTMCARFVFHCRTSAFENDLNLYVVILIDVQSSRMARLIGVWRQHDRSHRTLFSRHKTCLFPSTFGTVSHTHHATTCPVQSHLIASSFQSLTSMTNPADIMLEHHLFST